MNNIDKIFEMLNLKPGERFIYGENVYYFTSDLHLYRYDGVCPYVPPSCENSIFKGEEKIIKISDLTEEDKKIISEAKRQGYNYISGSIDYRGYFYKERPTSSKIISDTKLTKKVQHCLSYQKIDYDSILNIEAFDENGDCE